MESEKYIYEGNPKYLNTTRRVKVREKLLKDDE